MFGVPITKVTKVLYVVCIHLLLAVVLVESNFIHKVKQKLWAPKSELSRHYHTMLSFHSRVDKNLSPESVLFIGDSHIQGLAVSAVSPAGVNYGIGGDTTVGMIQRLPFYSSITTAKSAIIAIGFNDLKIRSNERIVENIGRILEILPAELRVVLCAIPPVGEEMYKYYGERIRGLNMSIEGLAKKHSNVGYLDPFEGVLSTEGYMLPVYHIDDNVHLSEAGYKVWIKRLTNILSSFEESLCSGTLILAT